jgi:hypothetical protein
MRGSYAKSIFVCIMLFGIGGVRGVEQLDSPRDELPKAVTQRIQAVQQDLANTKEQPFWAGKFVEGDGLGTNITLYVSPKSGAAVTNFGCLGLYGADEGQLSVLQDGSLKFAFSRRRSGALGEFGDSMLPVHWGERVYLLPHQRIYEFVLAANRGFEQLPGMGGGRFLNNQKAIQGLPELPEPYRAALRQKAVDAKVLHVTQTGKRVLGNEPMCQMRYEITIDQGDSAGLKIGEMLAAVEPQDAYADLKLESVSGSEATGNISILEDDCSHLQHVPSTAWEFSTFAIGEVRKSVE